MYCTGRRRDSLVSIVTSPRAGAYGFRISAGVSYVSLLNMSSPDLRAHLASYSLNTGGGGVSFSAINWPVREADKSSAASA
jgi:hypothetical protein